MTRHVFVRTRKRALRVTIIALAVGLATALAADAQVRGKADLVERQIGNPPTQLTAGESFVVGDVAANRGPVGAGWSVTRYFLVSGGTVLVAGARRVPAIKSRRRSRGRVRLSIPASAVAGQYSLLACVDATRRVAERNERNNCRAARGTVVVPGPGGVVGPGGAVPPPPPPVSSADSDGDGFPDSVDCAPRDPSIHPGAVDVPDPGFVDSNCDGIDGDPVNAVFVSPTGNDANPGTMSSPVRTLGVAVGAAQRESKDVYAAAGTYSEELRVASGVSVYGGYGPSWQRSLSLVTRITGATNPEGDTEGAFALGVNVPTTLQLLTIAPATPTTPGASSYGLRGVHSPALRLEHVTVAAAPGAPGAAGAVGTPGARGGNGGGGGVYLSPGRAGTSPVGHPGGAGGTGSNGTGSGAGGSGLSTTPDFLHRMGGPGGPGGQDGTPGTAGGRGNDGDFGLPILGGDGAGGTSGNGAYGAGFWLGHDGHDGLSGSDGHGGGGGGGGGGSGDGYGGGGGGGGGGAQGGGGGDGGHHGGGSFAIFLVECAGAIVSDSFLSAGDGGRGGAGGGGAFGGAGGAGGAGGDGFPGTNSGGNGGRGGDGGRGDDGGGGAGGPSAAVVGLTASDTPGTVLSHGLGGAGGAGGVGAGNGGGRGADGPAADYLIDFQ